MTGTPDVGDGRQGPNGSRWPRPEPILEAGIDFERANAARMYDYFLGGGHNFAVDREAAARVEAGHPEIAANARANRAFLGNAVRWCLSQGVNQFLDLGSGVPTVGNVHEIAHQIDATARVAYVDFEPVAVAHAQELLAEETSVTITRADVRDTSSVLTTPGVAELLDFDRPVALLALAVLHFIDGDVTDLLATYRSVLASGSVIAISHGSADHDDPDLARRAQAGADAYADSATPATFRSRAEIRALLDGLDVVPPGLVDVRDWPAPHPDRPGRGTYGVVARLP